MENFNLSAVIDSTDYTCPLGLEIWLNSKKITDIPHLRQRLDWQHQETGTSNQYQLRFVMKNKQADHTTVDEAGHIVKDARLIISDLCLDQVALGHIFSEQAVYTHNFNGTAAETQQKFYGEMGCNGTVCLSFDTPIYLWLLEHM